MKIGIVGSASRAVAWEKHLRPHRSVSEVIIAATLDDVGPVDACFLLDDTDRQLHNLLKSIKMGYHSYLISKLPVDSVMIEKVYHASEEANVRVQFSHWPTLAPASQWIAQKIKKPAFIQIVYEINYNSFLESTSDLNSLWIDELAYCLKSINGNVHHIDVNCSMLESNNAYAIHLFLRFDSGATSSIYINTCASSTRHQRFVSDHILFVDCEVESQTVRLGKEHNGSHLFFDRKTFEPSLSAETSATQFLKAIQLKRTTLYTGYDLMRLNTIIEQVKARL